MSTDHDGLSKVQKRRLRSHFGFTRAPFSRYMWASNMYDSTGQRDLLAGLRMWLELQGIVLITGPSGVGKSITLRRFVKELDDARYRVLVLPTMPSTPHGFLRSLCREMGLQMRVSLPAPPHQQHGRGSCFRQRVPKRCGATEQRQRPRARPRGTEARVSNGDRPELWLFDERKLADHRLRMFLVGQNHDRESVL